MQVEQYLTHTLGRDRLLQCSAALCRPSLRQSVRLNTLKAPAEDILARLQLQLSRQCQLGSSLHHATPPALHRCVPAAAVVAGLGPAQPDYTACEGREVVVSRHAGEAVLKGAHVYAPGLLAVTPGVQEGDLVAVSIARDLPGRHRPGITRGTALTPAAAARLPDRSGLFVGVGRAAMGRVGLFRSLQGLAVEMLPEGRVYTLPSLYGLLPGEAVPQALPCIVAAHELGPAPGSRVLDMSAAPGGKATMLAQLMADRGEVVALDRTQAKVCQVQSLASDLGLSCIRARVADATQLYQTNDPRTAPSACRGADAGASATGASSRASAAGCGNGEGSPVAALCRPESFDFVMLDPPCSALGLRPRLQLDSSLAQLRRLAAYQRALLHSAVHMLRPGGYLVYSTCTINPDENESNVAYALAKWPQLQLAPQSLCLGAPGLAGDLTGAPGLTAAQAALVQRFDPGGPEDTMGFFIAKFVKTGSTLGLC